jgi:hypothetical protein
MGCSTCKSKRNQKKDTKKVKDVTFENVESGVKNTTPKNNIADDIMSGLGDMAPQNFFLKLITFASIVVALPLLTVYLIFYVFGMFFFPKSADKGISFKGLINVVAYPYVKWKTFRQKLREKAKRREFDKNRGYTEDSDLTGVDVLTINKEKEYTGVEELEGVELLETANKDNDNG